ncbi:armadillo-type protein [Cantharellus anzutake]|uniref:armadillo-type protein n=1 Tax=Cantharellus anzutake TaxID=1750568 RepID=UPI001908FA0A|nr:armadillo-type protein [Cantharellus anzutake]KAF8333461.1 armadillo-type protein [Cantharellus anzutake]
MEEDSLATTEVLNSLSQALSNLILGDNQIRNEQRLLTEKWLATQPEAVILALAQLTRQAQDENMRSFAAVLLRRLVFRPVPPDPHRVNPTQNLTIYDHLSEDTRFRTERALLRCLRQEQNDSVRKKVADTITDLAIGSMERGRPWPELQSTVFDCTQSHTIGHRESAYRILASVPNLILDQDVNVVLQVLEGGLKDTQSIDVRHAALRASTSYLSSADAHTQTQAVGLMHPMLNTLLPLSHDQLSQFLRTLTPLTTSHPILFREHMSSLLTFLVPLILSPPPLADLSEATPTVGNPEPRSHAFTFPSTPTAANPHGSTITNPRFAFPPPSGLIANSNGRHANGIPSAEDEARDSMRRAALELLISLSEARAGMVKTCNGWVNGVVRCCLEGMAEIRDDGGEATVRWSETEEPAEDDDDYGYQHVFEEALDRLACAVGGKALLPVAFMYIPALLSSPDWMQRHAGLMAVAAIAEGTHHIMEKELGKVVGLVTPMFKDPHPRVRFAACQCLGQLCTDLEEIIQDRYHEEIFSALIPTLQAPEPRVHGHAAAAIINFCTGVDGETLKPYLDAIVEGLLRMLNANSKRYVQEQAITTLAMVADAAAENFRKFYPMIMPNLINVLRTATDPEMKQLRCKVMECCGLIAIAVERDTFGPDSVEFANLLMQIQNDTRPGDEITHQYLMSTWAKVCQALGSSFEPYLSFVMPSLLKSAAVKADISFIVCLENDRVAPEREGWEIIEMQGQRIEIRTASLEEKCSAFDALLIYCHVMGPVFAPYVSQTLNLAIPGLRFYLHDGVREAAAMLISRLVECAKDSNAADESFVNGVFIPIIDAMPTEPDAGFLSSLYKCFSESVRSVGTSALSRDLVNGFIKATQNQLHSLAQKRRSRADRVHGRDWDEEKEDIMLMEEMESFALDEMQKALEVLDPSHPLLPAVESVKGMRLSSAYDSDYEEDDDDP